MQHFSRIDPHFRCSPFISQSRYAVGICDFPGTPSAIGSSVFETQPPFQKRGAILRWKVGWRATPLFPPAPVLFVSTTRLDTTRRQTLPEHLVWPQHASTHPDVVEDRSRTKSIRGGILVVLAFCRQPRGVAVTAASYRYIAQYVAHLLHGRESVVRVLGQAPAVCGMDCQYSCPRRPESPHANSAVFVFGGNSNRPDVATLSKHQRRGGAR